MENYFYTTLNENTVEAIRRDAAFFMSPPDSRIPVIMDSYRDQPITGANYFYLKLSNDLGGKGHTEYVKMSEALSSHIDWFSTLPRESRPRGTLYQEESAASNVGYSFVIPAAELNQNIYRDNRAPAHHYVPFQSSGAAMGNFDEFVHEQFANAINASLTGCPFRNNIRPHEMEQFKTQLINEISRNPAFMAMAANRARDEALNYHCLPFDRHTFIERARDEAGPEFTRLNAVINHHVHDMHHNRKISFNPEFNELSRPLIIKVEKLYLSNPHPGPAVDHEISGFVRKMIRQDKTAKVLADTFAGTFVEKAIKLAHVGKKIFAGVMIAGAVCGLVDAGAAASLMLLQGDTVKQIMNFCRNTVHKMGGGDITPSRLDDVVKVAGHIMTAQELKGNNTLKTCRDRDDPRSFYTHLNQTIRDNPQTLDHAVARLNNSRPHDRTQSMTRGQAMRR
jgi:hypothetical protein